MTRAEYFKLKNDKVAAAKAVEGKAKSEKRELTPDEVKQINGYMDESDAAQAQVDRIDAETAEASRVVVRLHSAIDAVNNAPAPRTVENEDAPRVQVGRNRAEQDPSRGFRNHVEFFQAVMGAARAISTGRRMDERLVSLRAPEVNPLATAGSDEQSTFNDELGGFTVPETFSPNLMSLRPEDDVMGQYVTDVPMQTPTVKIPYRVDKDHTSSVSGGLRVYRRAESQTVTASKMSVRRLVLEANALFGVTYATEELLAFSFLTYLSLLEQGFRDEFASKIIAERINGTGVGEFLGFMKSAALVTVAKENQQTADTIVYENIIKMRARAWGYRNCFWLANQDTLPQFPKLNVVAGVAGVPVWMPSAQDDIPDRLLGRPLLFIEDMATLGDLGDIALVNPREYLQGTLQPLQNASSIHVRFLEHERTFKFWMMNAGAPWWDAALTPKKSTATLSPFVTLAERA